MDLGSSSPIAQFVVKHANAGGEGAIVNTRDFTIQVSDDAITWTTAVTVVGNTADVTTHPVSTSGRYVRLNITKPAGDGDTAARISNLRCTGPPATALASTVAGHGDEFGRRCRGRWSDRRRRRHGAGYHHGGQRFLQLRRRADRLENCDRQRVRVPERLDNGDGHVRCHHHGRHNHDAADPSPGDGDELGRRDGDRRSHRHGLRHRVVTTTTAANGSYSFADVPIGSRTISAAKSGFVNGSTTVSITAGVTTTANIAMTPVPPAAVQGTVTNAAGAAAIAGATVAVSGTALTTTTAIDGTYSFASVPTGQQTITVQKTGFVNGSTTFTATSGVTATANVALTALPPCADTFGYVCTTGPRTFIPADQTVVALVGDDAVKQITLPFPVKFYGQLYTTAWLDTNGLMSFAPLASSAWNHGAIPSPAAANKANLALYPFWDDLDDSSASIRTSVIGTAPNRQFIVEWRNVKFFNNGSIRVSFEIIVDETSTITFAYSGIDSPKIEQGGSATVGIENVDGTVALQYSLNSPVLRSGQGVTFTPPL